MQGGYRHIDTAKQYGVQENVSHTLDLFTSCEIRH